MIRPPVNAILPFRGGKCPDLGRSQSAFGARAIDECVAKAVVIEQPVHVRSPNPRRVRHRSVEDRLLLAFSNDFCERLCACLIKRLSHVDFVAVKRRPAEVCAARRAPDGLFRPQNRRNRKTAQAGGGPASSAALDPAWIVDPAAQYLQPPANADQSSAEIRNRAGKSA